jgi:hypothetical protein
MRLKRELKAMMLVWIDIKIDSSKDRHLGGQRGVGEVHLILELYLRLAGNFRLFNLIHPWSGSWIDRETNNSEVPVMI